MPKRPEKQPFAGQSLRSRKQARTRRELEQAALALFEANGYENTTVEQVAAAVEVSPRTFFRYFGSKEDVLFGDEEDQVTELRRIIRECPNAATDMLALKEALLTFTHYLSTDAEPLLTRAALVSENPRLGERSLRMLRAWELTLSDELALQTGMDTPDLRIRVLAASTMVALNVAVRVWLASGGEGSLATVAKRALDIASNPDSPGPRRSRDRPGAATRSRRALRT